MNSLLTVTFPAILTCISLLSFIGNVLVISFIHSKRKRDRSIHTRLKLSLASADLLSSSTVIISLLHSLISQNGSQSVGDAVAYSMMQYFNCVSILHVGFMAGQRYFAIKRPLDYHQISTRQQSRNIVVLWVLGIIAIAMLCISKFKYPNQKSLHCIAYMLSFILPLAVTIFFTFAMCWVYLKSLKNEMPLSFTGSACRNTDKCHRNIVRMTALITIGYGFTCLPYFISEMVIILLDGWWSGFDSNTMDVRLAITQLIFFLSGSVDVFVYSFMDGEFRKFLTLRAASCLQKL